MGKEDSIVYQKAFDFAVKIVKLYRYLSIEKKELVLSKQVLRSGTGIAANIREALEGQSKRDFVAKLSIALKEAGETEYWIELLEASEILNHDEATSIKIEVKELIKMTNAIIVTTKKHIAGKSL